MNTCKRSCCWNNFGVCGRRGECPCHWTPEARKEAALNQLRQEQLRKEATYAAKHPTGVDTRRY